MHELGSDHEERARERGRERADIVQRELSLSLCTHTRTKRDERGVCCFFKRRVLFSGSGELYGFGKSSRNAENPRNEKRKKLGRGQEGP